MSEEKNSSEDMKVQMLAAIAKKQKGSKTGNSVGPTTGSKVGSGQAGGTAPRMHRRKSGSA